MAAAAAQESSQSLGLVGRFFKETREHTHTHSPHGSSSEAREYTYAVHNVVFKIPVNTHTCAVRIIQSTQQVEQVSIAYRQLVHVNAVPERARPCFFPSQLLPSR